MGVRVSSVVRTFIIVDLLLFDKHRHVILFANVIEA
jgi:hypothetical protein